MLSPMWANCVIKCPSCLSLSREMEAARVATEMDVEKISESPNSSVLNGEKPEESSHSIRNVHGLKVDPCLELHLTAVGACYSNYQLRHVPVRTRQYHCRRYSSCHRQILWSRNSDEGSLAC